MIQLVRRAVEMLREPLDGLDVVLNGGLGVVTPLEFVQHRLSKMGHRNLLVTHTLPAYSAVERASRVASAAPAASFKRRRVDRFFPRIGRPLATDQDLSPLPRYAAPSAVLWRSV